MATGNYSGIRSFPTIALLSLLLAGCASAPGGGSFRPGGSYVVGEPYEIKGTWYYPAIDYNYERTGLASWYGADFDGKYTANGEIYDMNQLTAAHATLPLPSVVEVVNLQNGRSLQLRVNDRGPFINGRLIDVSRRSAQLLGFEGQGTALVRVKVMKTESIAAAEAAMRNSGQMLVAQTTGVTPNPVPMPAAEPASDAPAETKIIGGPVAAAQMPSSSGNSYGAPSAGIYIQAGAFAMRDNAQRVESRIARLGIVMVTTASVNGVALYRVRLGPVESAAQADRLLALLVSSGYPEARIVGN